ncbi:hypothetical protein J4526_05550 [Desulfurococcaceae archaeon MEX13E-LK6-19]|nr:hypothetical protein J4526_05550 [Desulfurococcaceae archaeon MEX13E-LK6-19]
MLTTKTKGILVIVLSIMMLVSLLLSTIVCSEETVYPLDSKLYLYKELKISKIDENTITYTVLLYIINREDNEQYVLGIKENPVLVITSGDNTILCRQTIGVNKTIKVPPYTTVVLVNMSITLPRDYSIQLFFNSSSIVIVNKVKLTPLVAATYGRSSQNVYPTSYSSNEGVYEAHLTSESSQQKTFSDIMKEVLIGVGIVCLILLISRIILKFVL